MLDLETFNKDIVMHGNEAYLLYEVEVPIYNGLGKCIGIEYKRCKSNEAVIADLSYCKFRLAKDN